MTTSFGPGDGSGRSAKRKPSRLVLPFWISKLFICTIVQTRTDTVRFRRPERRFFLRRERPRAAPAVRQKAHRRWAGKRYRNLPSKLRVPKAAAAYLG